MAGCGTSSDASEKDSNKNASNETSSNETEESKEESDHRIVATTYAIVEFLEALDLDAVGVPTSYKEIPDRYKDATEVGNAMGPDLETILSLDPTHVLSVTNLEADLAKTFSDHHIPADFLDLDTVDGMFYELEMLGETFNRTEIVDQIIRDFERSEEHTSELQSRFDLV